jgi:hypothetical protein
VFTGVSGITRELGAAASFNQNGQTYEFVSWSDGGARVHTVRTPDADTTYTATYRDASPPAVAAAAFIDNGAAPPAGWHRLRYAFSEDVSATLGVDDLVVRNVATGDAVPADQIRLSYEPATNTATFAFSEVLPNGNYRAVLAAPGVADAAQNAMAADYVLEFFHLTGDVNRDRSVNGSDFAILAGNFGRSGMTYGEGDLNGDGAVNGSDFALLAGNFGKSVEAPAPAEGAPAPVVAPPVPVQAGPVQPATLDARGPTVVPTPRAKARREPTRRMLARARRTVAALARGTIFPYSSPAAPPTK